MRHVICDWTDKTEWAWPDMDTDLIKVFDQVQDLESAIDVCKGYGLAVQAGGACGVWPLYLADQFERVITFEANGDNFRCLVENLDGAADCHYGALHSSDGMIGLQLGEQGNAGTWYTKPGRGIPCHRLDTVLDDDDLVDLLCLDVEGAELDALQGAAEAIDRGRPVIMLEEKPLPHMRPGAEKLPRQWLETEFGYQVVERIHRDVILC